MDQMGRWQTTRLTCYRDQAGHMMQHEFPPP